MKVSVLNKVKNWREVKKEELSMFKMARKNIHRQIKPGGAKCKISAISK